MNSNSEIDQTFFSIKRFCDTFPADFLLKVSYFK